MVVSTANKLSWIPSERLRWKSAGITSSVSGTTTSWVTLRACSNPFFKSFTSVTEPPHPDPLPVGEREKKQAQKKGAPMRVLGAGAEAEPRARGVLRPKSAGREGRRTHKRWTKIASRPGEYDRNQPARPGGSTCASGLKAERDRAVAIVSVPLFRIPENA